MRSILSSILIGNVFLVIKVTGNYISKDRFTNSSCRCRTRKEIECKSERIWAWVICSCRCFLGWRRCKENGRSGVPKGMAEIDVVLFLHRVCNSRNIRVKASKKYDLFQMALFCDRFFFLVSGIQL